MYIIVYTYVTKLKLCIAFVWSTFYIFYLQCLTYVDWHDLNRHFRVGNCKIYNSGVLVIADVLRTNTTLHTLQYVIEIVIVIWYVVMLVLPFIHSFIHSSTLHYTHTLISLYWRMILCDLHYLHYYNHKVRPYILSCISFLSALWIN